ncbi:Jag family protein [Edaphobacter bradus]|uniref:Jag family protein n=1 Tax=Edaphobacter bradus TaxID=2259016 RepID=UPI0021DFA003|nr:R3H domain-containing nucleic acid-binding protein [Edaphobacter bradus]
MEDSEARKKKVADFLQTLTSSGRLNLRFNILVSDGHVQPGSPVTVEVQPHSSDPAVTASPAPTPEISVELSGPDVSLLLAHNGELLFAIEHIAAKILRYEHDEHDRISFDADNFKVLRHQELRMAAEAAIDRVRRTGQPFSFAPMNSRERRILHLELASSGLKTASSGEGMRRFVVLYPEGEVPTEQPTTADRTKAIRSTFRRR